MAGHRNSVATQILAMEPRALYTHCCGHLLNLAMCDTIKKCKLTRDVMDVTHEISKLVKFLSKFNATFDKLKEELSPDTPSFRVLCPTHWMVWTKSLQSVLDNCSVLASWFSAMVISCQLLSKAVPSLQLKASANLAMPYTSNQKTSSSRVYMGKMPALNSPP